MSLKLTARHMDISEALKEWIEKKVAKYYKFHDHISQIEVTATKEKKYHQIDILVRAGKLEFHATAQSDELRNAFDMAHEKIIKQLDKKMDRAISRKKGADSPRKNPDLPDEAATFTHHKGLPAWIHAESIDLESHSVEDALEKLQNMPHRNFFIFKHIQSEVVNVIFKRHDDKIGLIEI